MKRRVHDIFGVTRQLCIWMFPLALICRDRTWFGPWIFWNNVFVLALMQSNSFIHSSIPVSTLVWRWSHSNWNVTVYCVSESKLKSTVKWLIRNFSQSSAEWGKWNMRDPSEGGASNFCFHMTIGRRNSVVFRDLPANFRLQQNNTLSLFFGHTRTLTRIRCWCITCARGMLLMRSLEIRANDMDTRRPKQFKPK